MAKLMSLDEYAKFHINELYTVAPSDFTKAFDAFISQHVTITLNGQKISREDYKNQFLQERTPEISANVTFTGVVDTDSKVGAVGTFYTALITKSQAPGPQIVLQDTSSMTMLGVDTKDFRRVTNLNHVSAKEAR